MDLRKIKTIDGLAETQFNSEPGRHKQLMILATGTNQAGQVGGFADIGRFVITRNGTPLVNRSCEHFANMGNIRAGSNVLESTDGAAFEASVIIPFFEKGHPNALNITDENELNIRFIPSDDGTVFADLDVQIQAQLVSWPERYNYLIHGNDITFNAAISADNRPLHTPNLTALYLDDVDDVVSDIQFESSGRVVISANSFLALRAYTNYNNQIEDDTFDTVEIENHTPGVPGTLSNRNNILRVSVSGVGDLDVTVCSIEWLNN